MTAEESVLGIFVGGRARRMGGFPKGLLSSSPRGPSIVEHLVTLARETALAPVLVGDASAYAARMPDVPVRADSPTDVGPLGGLSALLAFAGSRLAITVACDMPFVTASLLVRLRDARSSAPIVATRREHFEPFLARYDSSRVAPRLAEQLGAGTRSFQKLFATCDVEEFELTPAEHAAWHDWDSPEELPEWAQGPGCGPPAKR